MKRTYDGPLLFGGFVLLCALIALIAYGGAVGYAIGTCVTIIIVGLMIRATM